MAQDIFGRRPLQFGGAFAADDSFVRFGSPTFDNAGNVVGVGAAGGQNGFGSGAGLVTQNIQFTYQQPITRIYEVGTQFTYYIAGRPQGSASAARILGPSRLVAAFYSAFGNVCNAQNNFLTFSFNQGCNIAGPNTLVFLLTYVVLQSVGMSVSAQDMIINEQLSFFFTSLQAFTV
jgi:hypothetical protein